MRKSTYIMLLIPTLFLIEFVGVRVWSDGISSELRLVLGIFVMGLSIGQLIGVWYHITFMKELRE